MIERDTLNSLIERADKACRSKQAEDGLAPKEVITVLVELRDALDLLELAAAEGFRTPIQKELDAFLSSQSK